MERQEQVRQLDLYLAQHKGLLSNEEEKRYIDLIIAEGEKMTPPAIDGEEPQEEEPISLELLKLNKKLQLLVYDSSPAINGFTVNGQDMWFAPDLRANLRNALDALEGASEETVTFKGMTLPVANAKAMLASVELYAAKCAQVTEDHAKKIAAKKTAATVASYDFTGGYPAKPTF